MQRELFAYMECLWQSRFGCAISQMEGKVPSHQVGRILLYPHVPMDEYAYIYIYHCRASHTGDAIRTMYSSVSGCVVHVLFGCAQVQSTV